MVAIGSDAVGHHPTTYPRHAYSPTRAHRPSRTARSNQVRAFLVSARDSSTFNYPPGGLQPGGGAAVPLAASPAGTSLDYERILPSCSETPSVTRGGMPQSVQSAAWTPADTSCIDFEPPHTPTMARS